MLPAVTPAPRPRSLLEVMDPTGHTEVQWDPDDPEEVRKAEETFNEMIKRGYAAYRMNAEGKQGEQIRKFDAYAGRILMSPPMKGG